MKNLNAMPVNYATGQQPQSVFYISPSNYWWLAIDTCSIQVSLGRKLSISFNPALFSWQIEREDCGAWVLTSRFGLCLHILSQDSFRRNLLDTYENV